MASTVDEESLTGRAGGDLESIPVRVGNGSEEKSDYENEVRTGSPRPLLDLFAPLSIPAEIKVVRPLRHTRTDEFSSLSSFDMSSLTHPNHDQDEDANALNSRLRGGTLSGDQIEAFEKARELARSLALEDVAEEGRGQTKRTPLFWSTALFLLSFLCFACALGGNANEVSEFDGSSLLRAIETEGYRSSLFFSTGCCAPMLFHFFGQLVVGLFSLRKKHHAASDGGQQQQSESFKNQQMSGSRRLFLVVACGILLLTIFVPNVGRLIYIARGQKLSEMPSLYAGIFGFQLNAYMAIVCGFLTYHLPDRWVFRQLLILTTFVFEIGITIYTFSQTYPTFPYSVGVNIAAAFVSAAALGFGVFLKEFCSLLRNQSGREQLNAECRYVCAIIAAGTTLFLILDFAAQGRVRSVRTRDFDEFLVSWHIHTKTILMLIIVYLLPLRLYENSAAQSKSALQGFVLALSPDA